MLDNLTIFTQTGHVLHSKTFTPTLPLSSLLTTLISQSLLSSSSNSARLDLDSHSLRWVQSNDLQLIFVVVYQRVLQLSYIDELLTKVRDSFVQNFGPFCQKLVKLTNGGNGGQGSNLVISGDERLQFKEKVNDWDKDFSRMLRDLERTAAMNSRRKVSNHHNNHSISRDPLSEIKSSEIDQINGDEKEESEENTQSKNLEALKARLGTPAKGKGKKARGKNTNMTIRIPDDDSNSRPGTPGSGTATPNSTKKKSGGKEMRRWDGSTPTTAGSILDFSAAATNDNQQGSKQIEKDWVNEKSLGNVTNDGVYEIKDVEGKDGDQDEESEEEEDDDEEEEDNSNSGSNSKGGWLSNFTSSSSENSSSTGGIFSRLTSSRSLTSNDLQPALLSMSTHLQSKNVASDVATKVCSSVERSLLGKKLGSFGSVKKEVRIAMEDSVTRILTPRTSTDILLEIRTKRSEIKSNSLALGSNHKDEDSLKPDPYSITFVGVNGVGKSTNLAKVAFWLLQNKFKVLIAACDTFRSGAVEQLNVHVKNLSQLDAVKNIKADDLNPDGSSNRIELFQKGYGKDASGIANSALKYGKSNGFDVVLIDTAGRMQDNEPLMRSLSKLVSVNNPDKIIFVGEALVGNEAVDQLSKFDKALKDFSGLSNPRGLDGMLLTKFDTIDDKVGTCLTATSVTGLPIYFVGVGQTYTDLRQLRVRHVVDALMRD